MARIPDQVIERLKSEISCNAWPRHAGCSHPSRRGSDRSLLLPRGQDPIARGDAGEEPLALPGGVPGRGYGDRLGDESEGVSFRHAAELLLNDSIPLAASATGALPRNAAA